jgi:hypothetical protein
VLRFFEYYPLGRPSLKHKSFPKDWQFLLSRSSIRAL